MDGRVSLAPARRDESLGDSTLDERLRRAPTGSITHTFKCMVADEPVGLVVIDLWDDSADLVLYEIVVAPSKRKAGVGTGVLRALEAHARAIGRSRVTLLVRPLDKQLTEEELTAWYARRGYAPLGDGTDLFGKLV